MATLYSAFEAFNHKFAAAQSCRDLPALGDARAEPLTSKKGSLGLVFRTLGKLNHSYESQESLSALSNLATSTPAAAGASSPSVYSAVERLTLNSYSSVGNFDLLPCGSEQASLSTGQHLHSFNNASSLGVFFAALQEYLTTYVYELEQEDEAAALSGPDAAGAETIFPKLC